MNFKEIIKQEWEEEFPNNESPYENSLFLQYEQMVERICIKVWDSALDTAADNAEADVTILTEDGQYEMDNIQLGYDYEVYVLKNSILKFKL